MGQPAVNYGLKPDGTLDVCRARPENFGKGKCNHSTHTPVTLVDVEKGVVRKFNEAVLEKQHGGLSKNRRSDRTPRGVTSNRISSHEGGKVISQAELLASSQKVADSFSEDYWKFVQKFYDNIEDKFVEGRSRAADKAAVGIESYLNSDDEDAVKTREFLGKDVDLKEFSRILTKEVGSMTTPATWVEDRSVNRVILTALDNDMTKERYVASVMFFGGRCCYCNVVLRKSPPKRQQASGEHLTPVSPENPGQVHGGTRYGNMALACIQCNSDRGNQEMVSWVQETRCIPEEEKASVLGRIQAFRKFTLYHEYTQEENDRIVVKMKELNNQVHRARRSARGKELSEQQRQNIRNDIKIALYDLKHSNKM